MTPDRVAPAHNGLRRTLLVLTGFVGLSAVYGGIGLMTTGLGMPDDWLQGTPFGTWVVPGVLLLVVVAGTQLPAFVLGLRDHPHADRAALLAGVVQVGWIAGQLLVLQRFFFLQPVLLVIGAVEAVVAWRRLRATGRPILPDRTQG